MLDSVIGGFLLNTMQETQAVPMIATSCPPNANQLNVVRVDQTKPVARGIRHVVEICGRSRIHAADYQIITLRNILTTREFFASALLFLGRYTIMADNRKFHTDTL